MRFRDSLAVNAAPVVLRLVLAVTFLWAGYAKLFVNTEFTPEQIATLDAMVAAPESDTASSPDDASPPAEFNEPESTPAPPPPSSNTPREPLPDPAQNGGDDADGLVAVVPATWSGEQGHRVILAQDQGEYTDAQAADTHERRKLYGLALMLKGSATPDEEGRALLPGFIGQGPWPVRLAWLAALTEFVGGLFVLVGLLTRLSALGLGGTMLVALWLTNIGPVVMMGAPSSFWFLPALDGYSPDAWDQWLWQFALLGASIAVLLAGPGALSVDRLISGRRAQRRARPKPKPALDDE